jgi:hypothetical protein
VVTGDQVTRGALLERCWHGKFTGTGQCPEAGRYGNPEYRPGDCDTRLNWSVGFMRAVRWCPAHKHPGDRLLTPAGETAEPVEDGMPPEGGRTP